MTSSINDSIRIVILVFPLILAGCSYFFPSKEDQKFTPKDLNLPEIDYHADLEIAGDKSQEDYFQTIPMLMQPDAAHPTSTNALRYRASEDVALLKKALKNHGYFQGNASFILDHADDKVKKVKFILEPGPVYWVEGVDIEMTGADDVPILLEKAKKVINIKTGTKVRIDDVLDAVPKLHRYFITHGYPDVEIEEPIGKIDDKNHKVLIQYKIHLKGKKTFGKLAIHGNGKVTESFVRNRFHFTDQDFYDQKTLDKSRKALLDSELFSSVVISYKTNGGKADITADLTEAPPRRFALGARYATQEGIGGKAVWQHKNAFGGGEDFYVRGEGSQRQFKTSLGLKIPDVLWQDFNLANVISGTKARTKAYNGIIYNAYSGLEHKINETSTYAVGLEAEHSQLKRLRSVKRTFYGVPVMYIYDDRNDLLNPYKGWKWRLDAAPYFGDFGSTGIMLRASLYSAQYWRIIKKDKLVIATWQRIGQIAGVEFADIPFNRRWYGGGAGSIRGYGYQKLSKPNSEGAPLGGKSLLEVGVEPRYRINEKFGVSVFTEAGAVSETRIPGFRSQEMKVGYGVGGKYYTDIGPIRLDIAFPTKRRRVNGKTYDAPVQFYISLGQAF